MGLQETKMNSTEVARKKHNKQTSESEILVTTVIAHHLVKENEVCFTEKFPLLGIMGYWRVVDAGIGLVAVDF